MNRILDYIPSQESAVVSRILIKIHKAVDENFTTDISPPRQFTKTVFSDGVDGESTIIAPSVKDGVETKDKTPPPPEPNVTPAKIGAPAAAKQSKEILPEDDLFPKEDFSSELEAVSRFESMTIEKNSELDHHSRSTSSVFDSNISGWTSAKARFGPDWVTRISLLVLIAGVASLVYVLFF